MHTCIPNKNQINISFGVFLFFFFSFTYRAVIGGSLWAEVMLDRSLQSAVSDTSNSTVSFAGGAVAAFFISAEAIW